MNKKQMGECHTHDPKAFHSQYSDFDSYETFLTYMTRIPHKQFKVRANLGDKLFAKLLGITPVVKPNLYSPVSCMNLSTLELYGNFFGLTEGASGKCQRGKKIEHDPILFVGQQTAEIADREHDDDADPYAHYYS